MYIPKLIRLAAAGVAFVATIALTPTAAFAEASPPNCPTGYFCMYSGANQTGTMLFRTAGNWVPTSSSDFVHNVASVFNNGSPCYNCDHVDITYYITQNNEYMCLHYNPGPGTYKYNFTGLAILKGVEWRGEC